MTKLLIPHERLLDETRVAATPDTVRAFLELGLDVTVEAGAGDGSFFSDESYREAGAKVEPTSRKLWAAADLVLKVGPLAPHAELNSHEVDMLREQAAIVSVLSLHRYPDVHQRLMENRIRALALERLPRITRAQSMDALSSQASLAGYKAALVGASRLPRYFPLMMTAAGTVAPAKFLVIGAGVAGLQAAATARRIGAVVTAADLRPAVKEEVESVGSRFLLLPSGQAESGAGQYALEVEATTLANQREVLRRAVIDSDVVVCTAAVPERPAPVLIDTATIRRMRPGSIVVDLPVADGGNCELSVLGEDVVENGVTVLGPTNLPATMSIDASTLYARNVLELVRHLCRNGNLQIDPEDELVHAMLVRSKGTENGGSA